MSRLIKALYATVLIDKFPPQKILYWSDCTDVFGGFDVGWPPRRRKSSEHMRVILSYNLESIWNDDVINEMLALLRKYVI